MSNKMQNQNCEGCSTNDAAWLNVGYVQIGATASLAAITEAGVRALDIVVLAFADFKSPDIDPILLKAIQQVMDKEKAGTMNLLSIGGATVDKIPDPEQAVKNICAQISKYNTELKKGKISGVDLDLEGGITKDVITSLAKGFKEAGLTVSAAPQVYTSGQDISPDYPENLVLTSGGSANTYADAIEKGYVDYLFVQTYNSDGFKVGGYGENQVEFFMSIANALNNYAEKLGRIPKTTKIIIGEPANQGAGGECTIFNPDKKPPVVEYDHKAILIKLHESVCAVKRNLDVFPRINGVMMWSSNNDYMPDAWKDIYAIKGGFSEYIFDAKDKSSK
jgi:hypothetical protein